MADATDSRVATVGQMAATLLGHSQGIAAPDNNVLAMTAQTAWRLYNAVAAEAARYPK